MKYYVDGGIVLINGLLMILIMKQLYLNINCEKLIYLYSKENKN